jgi:OHCU decarboxylase
VGSSTWPGSSWCRSGLNDGIAGFNALSRDDAENRLYGCFACRAWASTVAAGRPYDDIDALLREAESAWSELAPSDWMAAFAAHPRIGESGGHAPASSEREQSGVKTATAETLGALASANRLYESRFGHVFLISASGRSAEDMLAELRERLRNDHDTELRTAAAEHRKITRLRLGRLLGE